ncbi:hypothetical protein BAZSYMA_ACONTIG197786_0 [Bathymodiolus azoricus thioautotrophic gill symbiont]|uniref:Uncharacterized protein n=1 Tax=Bathymodiolus azoricus thioautotrophic gill symbiont TaxID=235205 RepID=A0A1H6LR54_9GAMM|nr:hypothetical protein BAZSYMA_ACONTIG197786_0 [Bathymodiolus azoricus thioautotrophic gill symbiont]
MLYYSCFFSFLGIIKYEGLHNLVYRVLVIPIMSIFSFKLSN